MSQPKRYALSCKLFEVQSMMQDLEAKDCSGLSSVLPRVWKQWLQLFVNVTSSKSSRAASDLISISAGRSAYTAAWTAEPSKAALSSRRSRRELLISKPACSQQFREVQRQRETQLFPLGTKLWSIQRKTRTRAKRSRAARLTAIELSTFDRCCRPQCVTSCVCLDGRHKGCVTGPCEAICKGQACASYFHLHNKGVSGLGRKGAV